MKLVLALLMSATPQIIEAQATNRFVPEAQPFSGISAHQDRWMAESSNDTPTMRRQKLKRVAVFKKEVARLLAENGGSLTTDNMDDLTRAARKLAYRNR